LNAPGSCRLRAIVSTALLAWLGVGSTGLAQAPRTKGVMTKEEPKAKAPAARKEAVDLNSATAEELMTLPGVGEAFARKIIDGRPHKEIADLARAGVPARTIDALKPLTVIRPLPEPVDVNSAPVDRLETLPGVGPAMAREIVAARPLAGYEDVARLKGIGPAKLDALRGRLAFSGPGSAPRTKAAPGREVAPGREAVPRKEAIPGKEAVPRKEALPRTKADAREAPRAAPGARVDLNTATREQLDALPGIGPVKAQAIIDARPFATIEDVMKVRGIKEGEFAKIKDAITVK